MYVGRLGQTAAEIPEQVSQGDSRRHEPIHVHRIDAEFRLKFLEQLRW